MKPTRDRGAREVEPPASRVEESTPRDTSRAGEAPGSREQVDRAPSTGELPELDRAAREALQRGEAEALEAFFDLYFDRIHGYVRRLIREEHVAEDLTQDVFMHVHRSLASYDPGRPLAPWVYTIATNKVRDHWRSRRHRDARREVAAEEDGPHAIPSTRREPGELLAADELAAQVQEAVEELPEIMRTTLVLRYYEGRSFEEIGRIVDRNETAVRKRYSRALKELRQRLGKALGLEE